LLLVGRRSLLLVLGLTLLRIIRLRCLRITWLSGLRIGWLRLLLIGCGWWRRLTDDRSLCEGRCREGAEKYSVKDAGAEFIHNLFLWIREERISFY
jgi:hypothetical protein